jgi:hypothetical protein
VQLFAPFNIGGNIKNNLEIKTNKAEAGSIEDLGTISLGLRKITNAECLDTELPLTELKEFCWSAKGMQDGVAKAVALFIYSTGRDRIGVDDYTLSLEIKDELGDIIKADGNVPSETTIESDLYNKFDIDQEVKYEGRSFVLNPVNGLVIDKIYSFKITIKKVSGPGGSIEKTETLTINDISIPKDASQITTGGVSGSANQKIQNTGGLPGCSINPLPLSGDGTVMGCLAQGIYYLFFVPTSFVFGLTGKILDFTIFYSISDSSYRSTFVTEGWKMIKDFCNMFFIFVLLYIAFGTILNLSGVKTKEMIINVVIIGLLINFSLFTTQVIIDASNILTRVFYNPKTIITGSVQKNPDGTIKETVSEPGDFGEIKLSEAIVSKINPQELIMSASTVSSVPKTTGLSTGDTDDGGGGISIGSFILVVFLSTAVNIVGTIVFLSSALIFIGRVVMLWLAMILSPLAFFSYIVPQMQGMKMVGWKNWWHETLSMAFMAPVFAFFMYLIVGFMDKGLGVKDLLDKGTGPLNFVIGIVVPFAFIMVLLMKAKSMAVEMSGEMGAAMSKAGAVVGGLALGAATGGAALAMRGTVGRLGSSLANNQSIQEAAAKKGVKGMFARAALKGGEKAGAGSFDIKATKLGGMAGSAMGVDMGKAKAGGFVQARADKTKAREDLRNKLKLSVDSKPKQELMKKKIMQKELEDEYAVPIHELDGQITAATMKRAQAVTGSQADIDASAEIAELNAKKGTYTKGEKIQIAEKNADGKDKKDPITGKTIYEKNADGTIKTEKNADGTNKYNTNNGKISKVEVDEKTEKAEKAAAILSNTEKDSNKDDNTALETKKSEIENIEKERKAAITAADTAEKEAIDAAANAPAIAAKAVADAMDAAVAAERIAAISPMDKNKASAATIARAAANNAPSEAAKTISEAKNKATLISSTATKSRAEANEKAAEATKASDSKYTELVAAVKTKVAEAKKEADETAKAAADAQADAVGGYGKSINELKFKDIPHDELAIDKRENRVTNDLAKYINSDMNKVANFLTSGGVHDFKGDNEAIYNMKMGIKAKDTGGHSSPAAAHKPAPAAHKPAAAAHAPEPTHAAPAADAHSSAPDPHKH